MRIAQFLKHRNPFGHKFNMCGIAGVVGYLEPTESLSKRLLHSLHHRGPDDSGTFTDPTSGWLMIHTRLAIIDLSPAGHQPMSTPDGRYTIVFNGEIYNYPALKKELENEGVAFLGKSDTEVLLHLFARGGEKILRRLEGMFAFAIWDRKDQELFLARDPHGIKPLYYWGSGSQFAFASELRTLLETNLIPRKLDEFATAKYLMYGSVQDPDTLIQGVKQLEAGSWMRVKDGKRVASDTFWSFQYEPQIMEQRDATQQLRNCLNDSIQRHFVSDVPVGIFLSGGKDSTAITALANANGFRDLHTFCISFDEHEFNEGTIAQRTAEHFGTTHHDWRMRPEEGRVLFMEYLEHMDLPSNDGLNIYCVSRMAMRTGLKVVLSGLGADEQFGGYPSFQRVPFMANIHPRWGWIAKTLGIAATPLVGTTAVPQHGRLRRFVDLLRSRGGYSMAYWAMRGFLNPDEAIATIQDLTGTRRTVDADALLDGAEAMPEHNLNKVAYLESTRYMRNQLLRDSDVMSMANGLELRIPFVDRKLTDLLNRVCPKIRYEPNKKFLLSAVPEVPDWVANQAKKGFRFPFQSWMNADWEKDFALMEIATRVRLGSWYRKWIVFALNRFIQRHHITV